MPPSNRTIARLLALTRTAVANSRVAPSRYGHGDALWSGPREIAHPHSSMELDVRLHGRIQRMAALRLEAPERRKRANWIAVTVRGDADLRRVAELLALAYGRARS